MSCSIVFLLVKLNCRANFLIFYELNVVLTFLCYDFSIVSSTFTATLQVNVKNIVLIMCNWLILSYTLLQLFPVFPESEA